MQFPTLIYLRSNLNSIEKRTEKAKKWERLHHRRNENGRETIAWCWMHEICGYQRRVFCSRMTHIETKRMKTQMAAEKEKTVALLNHSASTYIEKMQDTTELIQKKVRKPRRNLLFTARIVASGVQCFQNIYSGSGAYMNEKKRNQEMESNRLMETVSWGVRLCAQRHNTNSGRNLTIPSAERFCSRCISFASMSLLAMLVKHIMHAI